MVKKIFLYFIIFLLIFSQVSAEKINNNNEKNGSNLEILNLNDDFYYDTENLIVEYNHDEDIELIESDNFSFFDIKVYASCWWSPIVWWESDGGLKCYNVYVEFRGPQTQTGDVMIEFYWVYNNGTEELFKTHALNFDHMKWFYHKSEGYRSTEEKPKGIKIKAQTDMNEFTKENNIVEEDILQGVSIDGYLYKKNSNGEKVAAIGCELYALSHFTFYRKEYFETVSLSKIEIVDWWDDGYFFLVAPVKPGNPPYRYYIKAKDLNNKKVIKQTEYVYPFENITMKDIVLPNPRIIGFDELIQNVIIRFPLIRNIFTFLKFS